MSEPIPIHGECDPRFAAVRETFQKNFDKGVETGASFAAFLDQQCVVDLWGGSADAAGTRSWQRDTIANVYSTTKMMAAITTLLTVDRGELDLDAPVADVWPEFGCEGKERLPLRQIMSHTSGLSGWQEPIRSEDLYDWDKAVGLLAAQRPWWEPGTASGYHALTHGFLMGEAVRRATGRTIGSVFREDVAAPLGADFHIGLSPEHDDRVAELIPSPRRRAAGARQRRGANARQSRNAW